MAQSSIMDRLAWRAKWRKRWQQWKSAIVIVVLIIILVPSALAFTPWAPQKVFAWIDENKMLPGSQELDPVFVSRLYALGMFYGSTMREPEATHCWAKICEWMYGYDIKRWAAETMTKEDKTTRLQKEKRRKFGATARPYVGYSLYRLGEHLDRRKHKGQAKRIYERYLEEFKGTPDEEPGFTQNAETFLRLYSTGG